MRLQSNIKMLAQMIETKVETLIAYGKENGFDWVSEDSEVLIYKDLSGNLTDFRFFLRKV